ncbi:beta-lactamase family protein (plasmid) [Deinococcus taeanensis]|uniref:serine hydrolase domain-containing protein n=1 Tax=Deinococcus taeanensis TaxID=2737050 RepID=UPI001CDD2153|nr:serine hydrolase domain-containing protein [Deinococcus taeanensis]UBV44274.1 beta-lactamase family protein [Deinococcus taeanensis]
MDLTALGALDAEIRTAWPAVTCLLVARNGQLAFERYYAGGPADRRDLQSVTKSVVSLLIGAALRRGVLRGLDQPVLPLLGGGRTVDPRWAAVTVRHLMTMTGGLPSELTDPAYDEAWFTSADPLAFTLAQPLLDTPGGAFRYSNAGVHLVGAALAAAWGEPLDALADSALFAPLGIRSAHWDVDPAGRPWAGGGLHLTARDLLQLGQLTLQGGRWDDTQLTSPGWVARATRPHLQRYAWMEGLPDDGLLWWPAREGGVEGWYAAGYGGQSLAVFPAQAMVVLTGEVSAHSSHRHLIPALVRTARH